VDRAERSFRHLFKNQSVDGKKSAGNGKSFRRGRLAASPVAIGGAAAEGQQVSTKIGAPTAELLHRSQPAPGGLEPGRFRRSPGDDPNSAFSFSRLKDGQIETEQRKRREREREKIKMN